MKLITLAWLLLFSPAVRGSTFTLGTDPNQIFDSENVGPYTGTLIGSSAVGFFCLDDTLGSVFGGSYSGTVAIPATQQQEEAAFLASYSLYLGAPGSSRTMVNSVEGPISFAIWQLMGTLGSTSPDPSAQPYIQIAQYAYGHNLIPQTYLNTVLIFSPTNTSIQRFITAVPDPSLVSAVVPEPWTIVLVGAGLTAGLAEWRRRSFAGRTPSSTGSGPQGDEKIKTIPPG